MEQQKKRGEPRVFGCRSLIKSEPVYSIIIIIQHVSINQ